MSGACTVEIVPPEDESSRTVILNEPSTTLSLPEEPFRYIVCGKFCGKGGKQYRVELQFEIGNNEQQS